MIERADYPGAGVPVRLIRVAIGGVWHTQERYFAADLAEIRAACWERWGYPVRLETWHGPWSVSYPPPPRPLLL